MFIWRQAFCACVSFLYGCAKATGPNHLYYFFSMNESVRYSFARYFLAHTIFFYFAALLFKMRTLLTEQRLPESNNNDTHAIFFVVMFVATVAVE